MAARWWTPIVLCVSCLRAAGANNLDTEHPVVFSGNVGSHFGYTVELISNRDGNSVLVSAIKDNSTNPNLAKVYQPGSLKKCKPITGQCTEVHINPLGSDNVDDVDDEYQYEPLHDDMHLGMSMVVQPGPDGRVIVCAPKWKNQKYKTVMYMMNGICYVLSHDLNKAEALRPLIRKSLQVTLRPGSHDPESYNLAVGEFGFSMSLSDDNQLIMGTPGTMDWTGSLVKYSIANNSDKLSPDFDIRGLLDSTKVEKIQQYIGYSVAVGRFFESVGLSMVAGAPRETEDRKGAVYFFTQQSPQSSTLRVLMKKEGEQMGSYFGASVVAVDLNNDSFSDLIVGAPFYSLRSTSGDEGRAYVYLSNGASLSLQSRLMGSSIPGARFATTIVNVGDLDLDGYPDVAIGAPYEHGYGAVYIYNGGKNGLRTMFSQRIEARHMDRLPQGFGISISKAVDIDDNNYPDIVIGAYESNLAYLLRAFPIAHAKGWIEIPTQHMSTKTPNCIRKNISFFCFTVNACIFYDGKFVPDELEFGYTLEIDTKKQESHRGGFEEANGIMATSVYKERSLHRGKQNCMSEVALIDGNVTDLLTPFEFRLTFNLTRNTSKADHRSFCRKCPVLDPSTITVVTNRTAFQVACGPDNMCIADLELKATIEKHEDNSPLVVGGDSLASLNIHVKNRGEEPAYLARVEIHLSENVDIINVANCETKTNSSLLCDVGNPLHKGAESSLTVKLGLTKIQKKLEIQVVAKTDSVDSDLSNNQVLIALPLIYRGDISLQGAASVSQLIYNESTDIVPLVHTFTLVKYYDSPIDRVAITISVPLRIAGKKEKFMTLQSVMADDGSRTKVGGSCNTSMATLRRRSSPVTALPPTTRQRRDINPLSVLEGRFPAAKVKTLTLDCSGAECVSFTCHMGPFAQRNKVAKIELSMILNVTKIMEQVGIPDTVEIISGGSVTILDDTEFTHYVKEQPKQATIVTSLVKEGPPAPYALPWWAYLLIVLGGLLLLLVIILVLYKCGFFRRKEKEELERSKRESLAASSAPHSPTTEALPSIPTDDPEVRTSLLRPEEGNSA
ncbi:integrin alpha-9-like isoform X2 [Haemaphysalis longicornis]